MNNNIDKELSFTLTVKVNSKGIEHELDVLTDGYTATEQQDVRDLINEDVDYLVEDMRRRVAVI